MTKMTWTRADIPDLRGRLALVTGANTGIGYHTAEGLAAHGATVLLACRSKERGEAACHQIQKQHPEAKVHFVPLDLAKLSSIKESVEALKSTHTKLHILVNNAGVMLPPKSFTEQGFELQFGVNYLGHFALTALLFPLLQEAPDARVVHVCSLIQRQGVLDFDNLRCERSYDPVKGYQRSKLANLVFGLELHRRLQAHKLPVASISVHPGTVATNITRHRGWMSFFMPWIGMDGNTGANCVLFGATSAQAESGQYYGPKGWLEMFGRTPAPATIGKRALDPNTAQTLWTLSEEACGFSFLS